MKPSKLELSEAFIDTQKFFKEDDYLRESVEYSVAHTKLYPEDFTPGLIFFESDSESESRPDQAGLIEVVKGRTLKTALEFGKKFPDKKICVLNFAAPTKPGGGVKAGSAAQEESICRSSTLYPTLITDEIRIKYYRYNERYYDFHGWDTCIYSPDIIICKDDDDYIPARLSRDEFQKIDVITCAAPHIHRSMGEHIPDDELFAIHVKRAKNILKIAAFNNVDIFIGGAFGCGAFHNNPKIVALAWHEALRELRRKFYLTLFAVMVYDTSPYELNNYEIFRREFTDEKL
ncbi:MAG: TIGR02452 family protein [Synergistaceae bacterium]|nr:TIGR02452 family protein [Synergistaceae bacterium]